MIRGAFNVVLDAQWGSGGKGKLAAFLAHEYNIKNASAANTPNAGHTVVSNGRRIVYKVLPSASFESGVVCWLAPGSVFSYARLRQEMVENTQRVRIHERACVVQDRHVELESLRLRKIASTMQGSTAAVIDKMMRDSATNVLAKNTCPELCLTGARFRTKVQDKLDNGYWLHEICQGYALSLDHGNDWPHCTSRNCTTQAALDTMGVPPKLLGDVYLNVRPFPIRVGSIDRKVYGNGHSGDWYSDQCELQWKDVSDKAGMPYEEAIQLMERERTTVTRRIRRVATMSWVNLRDAARTVGATKLVLNFAQYIDWKDHSVRSGGRLSKRTRAFVTKMEDTTNLKVVLVGTGEDRDDFVWL